jgi:CheY-like chemotaxis protein
VCKRIADLMPRGRIWCTSRLGAGSEFCLSLTPPELESGCGGDMETNRNPFDLAPEQVERLHGARILVDSDHQTIGDTWARLLVLYGAQVVRVSSMTAAQAALVDATPAERAELLLLDGYDRMVDHAETDGSLQIHTRLERKLARFSPLCVFFLQDVRVGAMTATTPLKSPTTPHGVERQSNRWRGACARLILGKRSAAGTSTSTAANTPMSPGNSGSSTNSDVSSSSSSTSGPDSSSDSGSGWHVMSPDGEGGGVVAPMMGKGHTNQRRLRHLSQENNDLMWPDALSPPHAASSSSSSSSPMPHALSHIPLMARQESKYASHRVLLQSIASALADLAAAKMPPVILPSPPELSSFSSLLSVQRSQRASFRSFVSGAAATVATAVSASFASASVSASASFAIKIPPTPMHSPITPLSAKSASPMSSPNLVAAIPKLALECPMRIMLVDDALTNQRMGVMLLRRMGYEIKVASDGQECLDLLNKQAALGRQHEVQVILLDLQMDGMGGIECAQCIRAQQQPNRLRPYIIAQTANTSQEDRTACTSAGMDEFMSKPLKMAVIVDLLRKAYAATLADLCE